MPEDVLTRLCLDERHDMLFALCNTLDASGEKSITDYFLRIRKRDMHWV